MILNIIEINPKKSKDTHNTLCKNNIYIIMFKQNETNQYESVVFSSGYNMTNENLEILGISLTTLPTSSGSDYVEFSKSEEIGIFLTKTIGDSTDSLTVEFTPGTINDSVVVEVLNSTARLARRITKGGTHLNRVVINFEPGSSNYLQLSTTGTTIKLHRILSPVGYVFKTPIMTGPTSIVPTAPWPESGWVATASHYYRESDYPAWEAFDGNKVDTSNVWHGATGAQWLQLKFPVKVRLISYEITVYNVTSTPYFAYKGWTIEGSNDNINWNVLDERLENSNLSMAGETFSFHVNFPFGFYYYLRLNMKNTGTYLAIQNMNYNVQLYGGGGVPEIVQTIIGISGHFSTSASTGGPYTLDFVTHEAPYFIYRIENEYTTIQYDYINKEWFDHGSDHPHNPPQRINGNQVILSSPGWTNLFTFVDPYF